MKTKPSLLLLTLAKGDQIIAALPQVRVWVPDASDAKLAELIARCQEYETAEIVLPVGTDRFGAQPELGDDAGLAEWEARVQDFQDRVHHAARSARFAAEQEQDRRLRTFVLNLPALVRPEALAEVEA